MKNKKAQEIQIGTVIWIVLALLLLAIVIIFTTGYGDKIIEEGKILFGIIDPTPPLNITPEQIIGYNILEDKLEFYDDGSQRWIELEKTQKFDDIKIEPGKTYNALSQAYYNRELPVKFELEKNSPSGATNRNTYTKREGFTLTSFEKSDKGSAKIRASYGLNSNILTTILKITYDNQIEELIFSEGKIVGQIEEGFSTTFYEENKVDLLKTYTIEIDSTRQLQQNNLGAETIEYLQEIKSASLPIKAWDLLQKETLEQAFVEIGVNKITIDGYPNYFTLHKVSSEPNKIKFQFYLEDTKPLEIFLTFEKLDPWASAPYIDTKIEVIEESYEPIAIGPPEQEMINKISEWRNNEFEKETEIDFIYAPNETEQKPKCQIYETEIIKSRLIINLGEPTGECNE